MSLQFSANISDGFLFNEYSSLLDRFRAAKKAGFQFVECAFPYSHKLEELVAVLEETGLKVALINSWPGSNKVDMGQAVSCASDEEFQLGIRKSIEYAKALGSRSLHFLAGKIANGARRSDYMPLYLRRLKWAAQECLPRHLTLVIEPISAFVNDTYFLNHFGLAVDVLAEIEARNLKIQLDFFHFQQIHPAYDVMKWTRFYRKFIGHIQIAQSPKRNEPHEAGDIDYKKILPFLGELLSEVYVGLEYKPSGSTEDGIAAGKAIKGGVFEYTVPEKVPEPEP